MPLASMVRDLVHMILLEQAVPLPAHLLKELHVHLMVQKAVHLSTSPCSIIPSFLIRSSSSFISQRPPRYKRNMYPYCTLSAENGNCFLTIFVPFRPLPLQPLPLGHGQLITAIVIGIGGVALYPVEVHGVLLAQIQ